MAKVILSGTKKNKVEIEDFLPILGDFFGIFAGSRRQVAGLALFWDKKVTF